MQRATTLVLLAERNTSSWRDGDAAGADVARKRKGGKNTSASKEDKMT